MQNDEFSVSHDQGECNSMTEKGKRERYTCKYAWMKEQRKGEVV